MSSDSEETGIKKTQKKGYGKEIFAEEDRKTEVVEEIHSTFTSTSLSAKENKFEIGKKITVRWYPVYECTGLRISWVTRRKSSKFLYQLTCKEVASKLVCESSDREHMCMGGILQEYLFWSCDPMTSFS